MLNISITKDATKIDNNCWTAQVVAPPVVVSGAAVVAGASAAGSSANKEPINMKKHTAATKIEIMVLMLSEKIETTFLK